PVADEKLDFLVMNNTTPEIASQIKASCYDCHSNQSVYPWYASVQPFGWWLKNHIEGGKKHLNFSEFGNYSAKKQAHKMEECSELVEEAEMPLSSYTLIHKEAVLDKTQREALINYFKEIEKGIKK
ncbi:MAG: heme-binding domain-containing protein, partial [Flavobacterium sp.]